MYIDYPRRVVEEGTTLAPGLPLVPALCEHCDAGHFVPEGALGICPSCGRAHLVAAPLEVAGSGIPELVVPFQIDEAAALKAIEAHITQGGWFLVGDLSSASLRKTLRKVWWPEWLVDADLDGVFSLEVGFNYQVESAKERFDGSSWKTFHEVDTRIRWEPRVGRIRRRLHNVRTNALIEKAYWFKRVGGTERNARAFEPQDMHGAVVRVPDMRPDAAWGDALPVLSDAAGKLAQEGADAEHKRDLAINARWANLHWTWQLNPAWTASYDDGSGQRWLLVVNGQTGKVTGTLLKSAWKLWLVWGSLTAFNFGLALFGGVLLLIGIPLMAVAVGVFLFAIGIILFVVGLLAGIFTAIPLFSGLSYNREQRQVQPAQKKKR